jgi:hypothetical protein
MDSNQNNNQLPGFFPRRSVDKMSVPSKNSDKHIKAHSRKQRTVNRYGLLAKSKTMLDAIIASSGDKNFTREMQSIKKDAE